MLCIFCFSVLYVFDIIQRLLVIGVGGLCNAGFDGWKKACYFSFQITLMIDYLARNLTNLIF